MRSKLSQWFECKISYEKTLESGMTKKVTEAYAVEAVSFAEAEHTIIEQMSAYISGEYEVKGVSRAAYHEVFFSDDSQADKWYKVKLQFITLDEKSGAEKKSSTVYLLQSDTFDNAVHHISEIMSGSVSDYVTANVSETALWDVFEH